MELRHREPRSRRETPMARARYLIRVNSNGKTGDKAGALSYALEQMEMNGLCCAQANYEQTTYITVTAAMEVLEKQAEVHKFLKPLKNSEEVVEFDSERPDDFEACEGMHVFTLAEETYLLHSALNTIPFDHDKLREHGYKVKKGKGFLSALLTCQSPLFQEAYPLHNKDSYTHLKRKFLSTLLPLGLPIEDLRNYYGEAVAYYFAWMNFYTTCVLIPAIVGILIYLFRADGINVQFDPYLPIFAYFMAIWGVTYTILWQRKSVEHSFVWNTYNYEKVEERRDEFHGEIRPDPVTHEPAVHYPHWKRRLWYVVSVLAMLPLLSVGVFAMTLSMNLNGYVTHTSSPIYVASLAHYSQPGGVFAADHPYYGWLIPAIGHAVVIAILNGIYSIVALKCTDLENHETMERWYSSLVTKRVVFLAIAYFMPLFYTAFYQLDIIVLKAEIASLFMSGEIRRVVTESVIPFFKTMLLSKNLGKGFAASGLPMDIILDEYDPFNDYLEMVMQFGYITLFAAAFPQGAAITLVFLYIEVRSDLFKLIHSNRRPLPMRANSIGVWYTVLQIIAFIAILTNCAIVGFSSQQLKEWMPSYQSNDQSLSETKFLVKAVFGAEHILVLVSVLLMWSIRMMPSWVRHAIERREYLTQKRLTQEAGAGKSKSQ
ncbi:hypothetical protein EMCRGX_G032634 [Ephydatia muelleri]|eukprot:Em0019g105a